MVRKATLLTCAALLSLVALPAHAELGAAGTRVSVAAGTPRFCMTYGHMDEPELFAPIMQELKRLQVTFEVEGDSCTVLHKGAKLATWRVIRLRDDIPDSGSEPFVLELGGSTFIPVKRLSKLVPIELNWDKRSNLLAVVAGKAKTPRVAATPKPAPLPGARQPDPAPLNGVPDPAATGAIELSGVKFERVGGQLEVRVQASGPVRPSILYLKAPARIALDFPDARWAPSVFLPEPTDPVRMARTGHPKAGQARLVLEIGSVPIKVAGVEFAGGEMRASLSGGTQIAKSTPSPEEAQIRAALGQRGSQSSKVALSSRGGNPFRGVPGSERLPQYSAQVQVERNAWQYIIIHHSAGTSGNAAAFAAQHQRKGWDGLAYHFVINNGRGNPDGFVEVSPRWSTQKHGAHAGALSKNTAADYRNGFNEFGIGICLVGNFERAAPTDTQLQVLAQLIQDLRTEFNIPADHVLGHGTVKGTACPGGSFPWTKLYAMMDLPAPQHLHRHPANLTTSRCPWCQEQQTKR